MESCRCAAEVVRRRSLRRAACFEGEKRNKTQMGLEKIRGWDLGGVGDSTLFWGGLGGKERWGVSRAAPVVGQKSRGESRLCPHRSHRSGGDGVGG